MVYRLVLNGKVIWDNTEFAKMLKNELQGSDNYWIPKKLVATRTMDKDTLLNHAITLLMI